MLAGLGEPGTAIEPIPLFFGGGRRGPRLGIKHPADQDLQAPVHYSDMDSR